MSRPLDGNLDGFLRTFRERPTYNTEVRYRNEQMTSLPASEFDFPEEIETDEDGRFELRGIGSERVAHCEVRGPDVESSAILVATRPEVPPTRPLIQEAIDALETPIPLYPAEFNHCAGPSRPIVGTVKEKDGGQPIAGARLRVWHSDVFHTAWSDADGRYSLGGLPVEGKFYVDVTPSANQPYLPASDSVVASGTRAEVRADFELARGVLVKGRLVNAVTQHPVAGYIEYVVFPDNDHYQQLASGFKGGFPTKTNDDGEFELLVLPGPGAIAAIGSPNGAYRFSQKDECGRPVDERGLVMTANRGLFPARLYNRVLPIDPPEGSDPIEVTLSVRPAPKVSLKLVDVNGRPIVSGVLSGSLPGVAMAPVRGDRFDVPSLDPDETRTVIFYHEEQDLAAGLRVSGSDPGTQTVTLRPAATLTGRLIDAGGRPVTDARVFVWVDPVLILSDAGGRTDIDGRFHITGLVPGVPCRLLYRPKPGDTFRLAQLTLRSGEMRDLGDIDVSQAPAQ